MKFEISPVMKNIYHYAKSRGVLYFAPHANEIEEEWTDENSGYTQKKREGLWCEDIDGFYSPTIKEWIKYNWDGLKEAYQKKELKHWNAYLNLGMVWQQWAWMIDSRKSVSYEIAFEKWRHFKGKNKPDIDELNANVSDEEIDRYIAENYVRVNALLYVSKTDNSCFVADERVIPFDMADGWSRHSLEHIMSEWSLAILGEKMKSKLFKGKLYI